MPTNTQRLVAAIASIGITVGGAWLASRAQSKVPSDPQADFPKRVSVTFRNVRNADGNVVVLVFADREAFNTYDVISRRLRGSARKTRRSHGCLPRPEERPLPNRGLPRRGRKPGLDHGRHLASGRLRHKRGPGRL